MIDLNDMSTIKIGDAVAPFYGAGESGEYIYGNDTDNDYYRYVITDEDIEYDGSFAGFSIVDSYALVDGANLPDIILEFEPEEEGEEPATIVVEHDIIGFGKSGLLELITGSSPVSSQTVHC